MKRIYLLVAYLLCCNMALFAFTQPQGISLNVRNKPLGSVFETIKEQAGYVFVYNFPEVKNIAVSIRAEDATIDQVMNLCLSGKPYSFMISDHTVIIKRKEYLNNNNTSSNQSTLQQNRLFKGKVVDGKQLALPGVSVRVKGTRLSTQTDATGQFQLTVPSGRDTLVFTIVGYAPHEEILQNNAVLDIVLREQASDLNEVVVVGYGTTKKINLTGAVSQISAEQLADRPVANLTQALQGQVPNLNITFGSGRPGQSGSLNIRGNTSINGGSPLVLIDGVPGDIDRVNPFDVESISVLKDASASAVYGARAAFGVILVTTKTAKQGKTTFNYSNNFGLKTHLTNTDFITTGYWNAKINDDAMYNALGNTNTRYTEEDYAELLARVNDKTENPERPWVVVKKNANGEDMYRYYANFDWFNYLFQRYRPRQEHNLSISGATEKVNYLLSANYVDEEGIWKINTDGFKRYNMRSKIDVKLTDWLKVNNNTRFYKSQYQWHGLENNFPTITNNVSPNHLYHFMAAYVPRNPDGTLTGYTGVNSYNIGQGMHAIMENGKSKGAEREQELVSTFEAIVTPFKGLSVTANYTYGQQNYEDFYRAVRVQYSKFPGVLENYAVGNLNRDQLKENNQQNYFYVYNIFGSYEKTMGDHYLKAMVGFNQEERTFKTLSGTGNELLSETLNDMNLATGDPVLTGGASEWALRGAFYRLNYDYKGRYLLEASGRYDGTSRFAKNDRFGFFPSFSAGWVLSEEPFFDALKSKVNSLKLRYSYGTLGNQDVATYAYISSMSTGQINYLVNSQKLNVINNPAPVAPSLTWERSITNNIGLDASFFKNRLSLSGDAYIRETVDMLTLGKTLPDVFGAAEPRENAADLRTKGFELTVNWKDQFHLGGSTFDYGVTGVLADYTATITRFDNPNKLLSNYYEGQRLGDIWGYIYDGYFKTTEEAQAYAAIVNQDPINNRRVQAPTAELKMLQAGDIKILDLDNNGIISQGANTLADPGDRRIIGNSQPRYTFGINVYGSWHNFDLSAFFQGVAKQNWYPHLEAQQFWHAYARPYGSFIPENFQEKIWSPENPDAYFPLLRGYIAQNSELSVANNMYLQDVGYVRLKNLTLGYTLPAKLTQRVHINSLRFYVSGENLLTWTKLDTDYIDPEEVMTDPTARTYPMAKTYSAGLQMTF